MNLLTSSIKYRLIIVIGFLSLLSVGIGVLGLTSLSATNKTLKTVYEHNVKTLEKLEKMVSLINANQILVSEAYSGQVSDFPDELEVVDEKVVTIKAQIKEIDEIFKVYREAATAEAELALIEHFDTVRKSYGFEALLPAVAALVAHDFQQVGEILQGPLQEIYPDVRDSAEQLIGYQLMSAGEQYEKSQERYDMVRNVSILAIVAGVVFASILGVLVIRAISRPLGEAVSVAQAVSKGNLTHQVQSIPKDETGQLMLAMQSMNSNLSDIVRKVRTGTDTISATSRDIASANSDLSKRTEVQASSLQEAASSLEELTNTVKTNAENATQANQLVCASAEVARKGGEVVGKVVDTMVSIKDSSSRIKDIVTVIDSISFQTNLLALNAAVEAARAGEQGRGFAVVAGEVRNLAQRSAEAAKEIKELIEDSVGKVDAGSQLVEAAGSTMNEIVESVSGVTDIMQEIATASQQQSVGIELVNDSVSQMDRVTQQNAAMVEEAAAAAEHLRAQAQQLEEAVKVFQISDSRVMSSSNSFTPRSSAARKKPMPELGGLALG